jgi:hypothetical protein
MAAAELAAARCELLLGLNHGGTWKRSDLIVPLLGTVFAEVDERGSRL